MNTSLFDSLIKGSYGIPSVASSNTIAPGALANLIFIAPTPGLYIAELWFGYSSGVPVAAELRNVQFQVGAAVFVVPVLPVLSRLDYFSMVGVINAAFTSVRLDTIGAGTAGVGYLAGIIATRIGP
jgi:hypothetical protein